MKKTARYEMTMKQEKDLNRLKSNAKCRTKDARMPKKIRHFIFSGIVSKENVARVQWTGD